MLFRTTLLAVLLCSAAVACDLPADMGAMPADEGKGNGKGDEGKQPRQLAPDAGAADTLPVGQAPAIPAPGAADGGAMGISDAGAAPAPKPDAGKPDATPPVVAYPPCFSLETLGASTTCADVDPVYKDRFINWKRKDGYRCVACKWKRTTSAILDTRPACLTPVGPISVGSTETAQLLCVASCGECH